MAYYRVYGTTFARFDDTASPQAYATLGQITAINGIDFSREEIDVTALEDTMQTFAKGIYVGEPIELTFLYDPDNAQVAAMLADLDSDTVRNYQVTLTNSPAETWTFPGLVTRHRLGPIDPRGVHMLTVVIRPTDTKVVIA